MNSSILRRVLSLSAVALLSPALASAQQPAPPADSDAPAGESRKRDAPINVVVTGTRVDTQDIDVPADVQVVRKDRLTRPGTKSAPAALTGISGVKMNPRGENAIFSDLEVRGLTGNATSGGNVLVLLDGIPLRRLAFGGPYLGTLPYDAVVRTELVKGPSSSLYGRNALAGALQLFTDPGSYDTHFDVTTAYEYPTNDARAGLKVSGPIGREPLGGDKLSTYSVSGSYGYMGGWQPRATSQRNDLYLHVNLHLSSRDKLTLLGGTFGGIEEYVAPVPLDASGKRMFGVERDANLAIPNQNALTANEARLATRYTRELSRDSVAKVTVSFWRGDTYWKTGRPDDRPATGTVMARAASDRHFLETALFAEAEASTRYKAGKGVKGTVSGGVSYEYLTYSMTAADITTDAEFAASGGKYTNGVPLDLANPVEAPRSTWLYGPRTQRDTFEHDAGAFVRKQIALLDHVFVHGGLRYDTFKRIQEAPATGQRAEHTDSALSPSIGWSVAAIRTREHKLNVFGQVGRGFSPVFRAVNNTQFADVKPETSQSVEAGVKTRLFGRFAEATASLYQLHRNDIVAMNTVTRRQENVGDWRIRGIETDLRIRPIAPLSVRLSYAYRDPIIERYEIDPSREGNRIPAIAKHMFVIGTEARSPLGLGGGTEVRYTSASEGNEQNSFELPAHVLWDAWVFYDVSRAARVSVYARNLLDADYYTAVFAGSTRNGAAFAGTPRTVGLNFTARL